MLQNGIFCYHSSNRLALKGNKLELWERTEVFTEHVSDKSSNDERNTAREKIIENLFSIESDKQALFLKNPIHKEFWHSIKSKLDSSLTTFIDEKSGLEDFQLTHLVRKGGRNNNYDFFAPGTISGEDSGIKLEFKKGSTIFDQPEFLSLWAKSGILINASLSDYPNYFYDTYIHDLANLVGVDAPPKNVYLRDVYKTNYVSFFGSAKSVYDLKRDDFLALQYKSIDEYLHYISETENSIDFDQIQGRLSEQLDKYFVSWDSTIMDFTVEQFHEKDVTLDRTASFTGGKNGWNNISLKNLAGNNINALLRWKNRACVVGPGWQISLKSAYVK